MARASLEIQGLRAAQQRIDRLAEHALHPLPRPVGVAIEKSLKRNEARRFKTGRGWRKLTPGWVQYKRRHGYDARKLVMTGGLEHTLTIGGPDLQFTTSRYSATFGLKRNRRYTAIAKIRKPVMADRESRDEIARIVAHFVASEHR